MTNSRPRLSPFDTQSAATKVRMAQGGWNSRDAVNVSLAYTQNRAWRNRSLYV